MRRLARKIVVSVLALTSVSVACLWVRSRTGSDRLQLDTVSRSPTRFVSRTFVLQTAGADLTWSFTRASVLAVRGGTGALAYCDSSPRGWSFARDRLAIDDDNGGQNVRKGIAPKVTETSGEGIEFTHAEGR